MQNLKKGNILLPLISAIAIISIVAAGYFLYQNQQLQKSISTVSPNSYVNTKFPTNTQPNETANWKTYSNNDFGFAISYPPNWYVAVNQPRSGNGLYLLFDSKPISESAKNENIFYESDWPGMSVQIRKGNSYENEISPDAKPVPISLGQIKAVKVGNSIYFNKAGSSWQIQIPRGIENAPFDQIISTFKVLPADPIEWRTVTLQNWNFGFKVPAGWFVSYNFATNKPQQIQQDTTINSKEGLIIISSTGTINEEYISVNINPALTKQFQKVGQNPAFDQIVSSFSPKIN